MGGDFDRLRVDAFCVGDPRGACLGSVPFHREVLVIAMNHENEPLPVCNFCEQAYDPHDRHTCIGNNIEANVTPAKTRADKGQDGWRGCGNPVPAYPEFEGPPGYAGSALDTQQGGDHYRKLAIQPIEYIIANGLGFLQGNLIKYATRYRDKGGAEDVRKIIHYCQLILEFEYKEKTT